MPTIKNALRMAATSLAIIVLVALCARLGFAWHQERGLPPNLVGTLPFWNETGSIAQALAQGRGFSDVFRKGTGATAWLTPVYPLVVAGVFRVFGIFTPRAFFAVVFLNSVFSAGACVPLFFVGKRIHGIALGSGAAWLWALFPNAIMIPFEWVWDTSLSALLAAAILWATLEVAESQRLRDWCAYGLLWGLALMTNPALASLLLFLLGWAAYRARQRAQLPIGRAILAAAAVILCCIPWTVRNYVQFHRFIPLRSNFAFELWLGNNEVFDEHSRDVNARVTSYEQVRTYLQIGETAFMERKWQLAMEFERAHPRLEFALIGRRIVATWMGTEAPIRNFIEADSVIVRGIFILNLLVAIGAFAGIMILYRRRSSYTFPLAVFPVVFPLLYYATHTSLRYRHPIDPILMLSTAIAVEAMVERVVAAWRPRNANVTD